MLRACKYEEMVSRIVNRLQNDSRLRNCSDSIQDITQAMISSLRPPFFYKGNLYANLNTVDLVKKFYKDLVIPEASYFKRKYNSRRSVSFDVCLFFKSLAQEIVLVILDQMGPYIRSFCSVSKFFWSFQANCSANQFWLFKWFSSFENVCLALTNRVYHLSSSAENEYDDDLHKIYKQDLMTIIETCDNLELIFNWYISLDKQTTKIVMECGIRNHLFALFFERKSDHLLACLLRRCRGAGSKKHRMLISELFSNIIRAPPLENDAAWKHFKPVYKV